MALANLTQCAKCGADATMTCAGCVDAPEYQPGDSVGSVYCNRECQKEDYSNHKAHCRALRQRKKILRTAHILRAALLAYREVAFDVDLTKIELRDGVLCLHQNLRRITTKSKRGPFPDHLTTNIDHKNAALANNQCTTAMALLGRLSRKLLKGVASTIEVLDLHVRKPLTPTKLVPGPDASGLPHTVLKVGRLFCNEAWILDTTGCQYGFKEVLVPYEKYLVEKSCRIASDPVTYDATETKDLDFFSTLPFMNRTRGQRENMKLERKSRLRFADFVDKHDCGDVLNGSTDEFEDKLHRFLQGLKLHILKGL